MTAPRTTDHATNATPGISIADARFIRLTTFRRTGEPVATPVLFAIDGDRLLVRTAHDAGKLNRLAHTSRVEVAPCDQRGRELGAVSTGQARILGEDAVRPALTLLHGKHRIVGPVFTALRHLRGKRDVIIEIALDRPAPTATAARRGEIRVPAIAAAVASLLLATILVGCASGASSAEQATGPARTAAAPPPSQDVVADAPTDGALDLDTAAGLCAIFPADRAAAALGESVGPGKATHSVSFGNASCTYDSSASDATITIWYHPDLTRSDWDAQMAKIGMTADMAVSGIGEAAYRSDGTASHPRVKLAAFEGDHDIWVIITKTAPVGDLADTAEREARELLTAVRKG